MIVLVLSAVPEGLRGHVSRWLLEISPGVFVGRVNARVRERLWESVKTHIGGGRAVLVFHAANEQGLSFLTLGDAWEPTDFEGLTLMVRPNTVDTTIAPELRREAMSQGKGRRAMSDFERRRRSRLGFPRSDRAMG